VSELHVHQVMCPIVERERDYLRDEVKNATRIIVALRRKLIAADPSLPNEYDGTAWVPFEGDAV
jgi:hypothetical protein